MACWTEGLSSLLAGPATSCGTFPWVHLKHLTSPEQAACKRENKLAGQKSVFCDLILEVTSHQFCSIVLIRSVIQPTAQEREFYKVGSLGAILEACVPHTYSGRLMGDSQDQV